MQPLAAWDCPPADSIFMAGFRYRGYEKTFWIPGVAKSITRRQGGMVRSAPWKVSKCLKASPTTPRSRNTSLFRSKHFNKRSTSVKCAPA